MKKILSAMLVIVMLFAVIPYSGVTKASAMETVAGSYDYLWNCIDKYGTDVNGKKVLPYSLDVQNTTGVWFISKDTKNNLLEFVSSYLGIDVVMYIEKNTANYPVFINGEVVITEYEGKVTIDPKLYYKNKEYYFNITPIDSMYDSVQKSFRSQFHLAISGWEIILEAYGISLANFGFTGAGFTAYKVPVTTTNYTVTYNANGGSVSPSSASVESGKSVTLPTPTRSGYTCLGWSTSSSAASATYQCGAAYKPTSNVTLYAVWKANSAAKYTVTYNANGGSVSPSSASVESGKSVTLPTPTRSGYTCLGWSTSSSAASAAYQCGAAYKPTSNVTLYAVWGKVSSDSIIVSYPNTSNSNKDFTITVPGSPESIQIIYPDNGTSTITRSNSKVKSITKSGSNEIWVVALNLPDAAYKIKAKYSSGWDYLTSFKVSYVKYNGLVKTDGVWRYYKNGSVDKSFEGMAKNDYGWWYVKNGTIDFSYTGMAKNQWGWWYMKNGKLDTTYTGMAKNQWGWWYMKNGKLDTTYTGMAKGSDGWMYVTKGKLDTSYTGMAKNQYGWFYIKNGKLDTTYTGMAKNQYGWWYMKNGKLDTTFTGISKNQYGNWYMKNGKLNTSFSGNYTDKNGTRWVVTNGKAVKK